MLYLSVKFYLFKENVKVIYYFYKDFSFALADSLFHIVNFLENPYRACRKFYEKKIAERGNIYGETPLTSLKKICHLCGIHSKDKVIELGSGRGRTCFFLSKIVGAKVKGVEKVPSFVKRSNFLKKILGVKNLEFTCEDFFEVDFRHVNVVYLYAPHLEDEKIVSLSKKLLALPKGAKVITISYSLNDYAPKEFNHIKRFSVSFPWGMTHAYLSIKG